MKKINIESIKKVVAYAYVIYCICYCVAAVVTLLVLYKDQIKTFIKKVMAGCKQVVQKLAQFFKRLEDKLHPTKADYSWIADLEKEISECTNQRNVADLFECSEE